MAMQTPIRTAAPAANPVTLAEAKAHLRVTDTAEDTLIGALIDAAVGHLDGWSGILGRCLVTQTWAQKFECFDGDGLDLPFPDVQSVTVTYYDATNTLQTLSSSVYNLVNEVDGCEAELAYGASWPTTAIRPDAVTVSMVCGYGAASAVPAAIKMAILLHIGHLFANREAVGDAGVELPLAYAALLAPYRRVGL